MSVKKQILFRVILFFLILSQFNTARAGNSLKNSGFEKTVSSSNKNLFCEDWPVSLGSRAKQCSGELSAEAYKGKYSLKLTLKGSPKDADLWTGQIIKVTPGTKLKFKVYAKGTKGGRFYVQFLPVVGRKYLKPTYINFPFSTDWKLAAGSYTVPENVNELSCLIHMVGKPAEGYFDEFEVTLDNESVLDNKKLSLKLNPLSGGCIDSFIDKEDGFNYTLKRLPGSPGGLCVDILPGDKYPGLVANSPYKCEVITPLKEIRFSREISSGSQKGLYISKTYSLPSDDSPKAKVVINIENKGDKALSFSYRVQNFISPASGIFSYPSRDWLTIFNRTPESIKTINTLKVDDLRSGWGAKKYNKHKALLFQFENNSVSKVYNYLVKKFDTLEWYYIKITIKPNESWKTEYLISLKNTNEKHYTGGLNYKAPPVQIKGIKLAAPKKEQKQLPSIMQGYFPFGGALSNVVLPEDAGTRDIKLKRLYACQRQVRELADNYFNNFYFAHLFAGSVNLVDPLGEEARHYNMTMTLNMPTIFRSDVETDKFSKNISARIKSRFRPEILKKTIAKYKDSILCYFTGDELFPSNINCMVLGHEALNREIDPEGAFIPYLILGEKYYELAKYLPVYIGDHYPVYQSETLTRNPWSVGEKIKDAVKALPDTRVWYMFQGFGSVKDIYALPTPAETRLMIYLSVASGAKGILTHGLNGAASWLVKSGGEKMPMLTAEGAIYPAWEALGECGKELTAIGPRLFYTTPEWNFNQVKISCQKINKTSRNTTVYAGPAITVSSLKNAESNIRYLLVINQDDINNQNAVLSFDNSLLKQSCYDLSAMQYVKTSENLNFNLKPGDAKFFILGAGNKIKPEIEQVFNNRYIREKARYVIASERAGKNGIKTAPVPQGIGESAYKAVIAVQNELQEKIDKSEFGKILKRWKEARELISKTDFVLKKNLDSIVPKATRDKTPHFREYAKPSDPVLSNLISRIKSDIFNYWKLNRAIENGKFQENKTEINELIKTISADTQEIISYFEK
jgi:hypothetical protein